MKRLADWLRRLSVSDGGDARAYDRRRDALEALDRASCREQARRRHPTGRSPRALP